MRLLLLFIGIVSTFGSAFAADPPNLAPLKRWLAHQGEIRSVQADFIQTRSFHALRDPLASPGHLWFSAPQSFRWELGDPAKTVVLRKGETAYLIQPTKKRAEHLSTADLGKPGASNPLPMMDFPLAKSFDDFNRQFEVLALTQTGTRCHVELQPRDPQTAKFLAALNLDFDAENGYLLSFEARTRDGSSMRNEFNNVRLNAKIDPHVFDFDLTGFDVTEAKNSVRRFLKIAALVAGLGCVALGLSRISFNVDILRLLPTHLRQVQGLSLFLKHFAQPDELIITVEAADQKTAEAAADDIAAVLNREPSLVKRAVARLPWEKQPGDLAELLAFMAINQPPETVRDLTARLSRAKAADTLRNTLERLTDSVSPQEIALLSYDPFDLAGPLAGSALMQGAQQSEFASADGTFHVVYVEAAKHFDNYNDTVAWIEQVRRLTSGTTEYLHCRVNFTGEPAIVASIASSMQRDMQSSGLVTLLIIALIFWTCYRRAWPLLQLQGMLLLIFVLTLAIAGLFFDQLTVIGVGSAAIMIGLSVDYGYFVYQRSQRHTGTLRELQRQCLQYIAWTAGTTAAAFFALNVSSLPGLSQLGNLVGVGVIVGAIVMLTVFAPLTLRRHQRDGGHAPSQVESWLASLRFHRIGAWCTLALIALLLGTLAIKGFPGEDFSARPLRPRHSEAYAALDRLSTRLMEDQCEPLSLVVEGPDEETVRERLLAAESQLSAAQRDGDVKTFRTALALWPNVKNQEANLPQLRPLADQLPRLRQTVLAAGFEPEAFALTEAVLRQCAGWSARTPPIWPDNEASRWILRRLAKHADGRWYALGYVQPVPGHEEALDAAFKGEGIYLTGWPLLTTELRHVIPREFALAIGGIAAVVLLLLALAFRDWRALALFVGATALVFVCLAGAMSLLGLQWNVFNLAALLLLLGTGTDYSILLLLALRRNGGDVGAARRELALVVCLCAASASAGFGTISWANHAGLASLGQTCALGLLIDAAVSVFLIPPAWAWLHAGARKVNR